MAYVQWVTGVLLASATLIVIYAAVLYYGFERVGRPSPWRFNTWLWIGLAALFGVIAVAIMLLTGQLEA